MRNNLENESKCLLTPSLAGLIARARLSTGSLWTSSESILLRRTPTQMSWRKKMYETWASSRGISRRAPPREAKRASSAIINTVARWVKDRNHFSLVYHSLHVMEAQYLKAKSSTFRIRICSSIIYNSTLGTHKYSNLHLRLNPRWSRSYLSSTTSLTRSPHSSSNKCLGDSVGSRGAVHE